MDVVAAIKFLNDCDRLELRDHAFGDCQIGWLLNGIEVGGGYFSGEDNRVWLRDENYTKFNGADAMRLRSCGTLTAVARNDSTGPVEYSEGVVMDGMTRDGVASELLFYAPKED